MLFMAHQAQRPLTKQDRPCLGKRRKHPSALPSVWPSVCPKFARCFPPPLLPTSQTIDGHKNFSLALNATGRPMAFELCRGDYEKLDKWGYAPGIAQLWRADGDHHDSFSHTLEQLAAIKGKSTWSGPFGWAYMDMMMTGGQGCEQVDPKHPLTPDPDKPCHAPGCTDAEYRTEGATYAVSASPMMIGTDIRLMTPIMKQVLCPTALLYTEEGRCTAPLNVPGAPSSPTLMYGVCRWFFLTLQCILAPTTAHVQVILNPTLISVNQDHLAPPGYETTSCGDAAWVRHLSNGSSAVTVVNMAGSKKAVQLCLQVRRWASLCCVAAFRMRLGWACSGPAEPAGRIWNAL